MNNPQIQELFGFSFELLQQNMSLIWVMQVEQMDFSDTLSWWWSTRQQLQSDLHSAQTLRKNRSSEIMGLICNPELLTGLFLPSVSANFYFSVPPGFRVWLSSFLQVFHPFWLMEGQIFRPSQRLIQLSGDLGTVWSSDLYFQTLTVVGNVCRSCQSAAHLEADDISRCCSIKVSWMKALQMFQTHKAALSSWMSAWIQIRSACEGRDGGSEGGKEDLLSSSLWKRLQDGDAGPVWQEELGLADWGWMG